MYFLNKCLIVGKLFRSFKSVPQQFKCKELDLNEQEELKSKFNSDFLTST